MRPKPALLLVANWDSNVGYAWWLIESFWAKLAEHYNPTTRVILAYPSISKLPATISEAPLQTMEQDFSGNNPRRLLKKCQFLRRFNVKALYFSDRPTWHWSYLLYRLCGVRMIVVHDHTPGTRDAPKGLKALLKFIVHRIPWLRVDGAIGATDFVRKRLITVNKMPINRCFAAHNGLPEMNDAPAAANLHSIFQIPKDRKILIMAGRANRYKGVDFALKCLARLIETDQNDVHFLFIGDGPDLKNFKKTAQQNSVFEYCTFAGKREDIISLLTGADIAFHPSHGEVGYSLSILEYMRAGLPVVVPDNPSICEATEHGITGMIYPEGNIKIATEYLRQLLNDNKLRTWQGEQARNAAGKFTLESTHNSLIQAFEKISATTSINDEFVKQVVQD